MRHSLSKRRQLTLSQTKKVRFTTLPGTPPLANSQFATDVSNLLDCSPFMSNQPRSDMPAKITLFDTKTKPLYCFGSHPRNFISYQPQGKLLLTAGFGNLAGGVDVWDVSTRNKIAEFK